MQLSTTALAGTPPLDSPEFWRRPYRVPASPDPDTATGQTVEIMCGHVHSAASDRGVQDTAAGAWHQFAGLAGTLGSRAAAAGAAFWWPKLQVKFVHHEKLLRGYLGEAGHLQGLISPEILVRLDKPQGDCAIFSECVAAFLSVYGVPWEVVTVAVNPDEPDIFSHVFIYAILEDGRRLPLDASHGAYPGWQVPSRDVFRRQVWDSNGRPVADQGSRFDGLHNYGLRGGLGAAGDCLELDDDGSCLLYDYGTAPASGSCPGSPGCPGYVDPSTNAAIQAALGSNVAPPVTPVVTSSGQTVQGYTVPSQSSAAWAQVAAALVKGGMTLAQIQSIQPGTVVSANGAILRQSPGYAVPVGTGIPALSTVSLSNMLPWLLLLGAGAVVLSFGKK